MLQPTFGEVLQRMVAEALQQMAGGEVLQRMVAEALQQMAGGEVLQLMVGRCCNQFSNWGGVATDGRKVLQQTGEVGRERCNRTLQYFTVDGLP